MDSVARRRLWLLAPFGGESRLLLDAERRLGVPPAMLRVYADARVVSNEGMVAAVALSFLFVRDDGARRERLEGCIERLGPGGTLVVLDHNVPRRWFPRAAAHLHWSLAHLGEPATRRLRRPAARELQAAGMEVLRLRFLAAELFQAILARKP